MISKYSFQLLIVSVIFGLGFFISQIPGLGAMATMALLVAFIAMAHGQ